jgi:myb proto-oncogene protein
MGAPKQKWTQEEESALKAGVIKHGAGKWRTILKDPEYSYILYLRSNVDLKDKWRNMSVMNNGWTSREKSSLSVRRTSSVLRHEDSSAALSLVAQDDDEMDDEPMPLAVVVSNATMQQVMPPKRSIVKLDNLIMEAITNLGEPGGSNKTTIAAYIEDQYWTPSNFKRILSAKLKFMAGCGKLIKVKRRYRIAPASGISERGNSPMLTPQGTRMILPNIEMEEMVPAKAHFNLDTDKMRTMTLQEAAVAVTRAVAEAEAAMLEAEEATREAEAAEADAEEKQAFADAAMKTFKGRNSSRTNGHR